MAPLTPELVTIIGNGSVAAILFVMWYLSFRQFSRQHERAFKQNQENLQQMFKMMEQDSRYKELLTNILTRLELKLDLKCSRSARDGGQ